MRVAIVLGSIVALAALGSFYFSARTSPAGHEGSPAFQALLEESIARLEGVTTQITSASVADAHAEVQQETFTGGITCAGAMTCFGYDTCTRPECWDWTYDPSAPTCEPGVVTCDAVITCTRFYTCDSQYTCHGESTCNGCYTCWFSTCDQPGATYDGTDTCYPVCQEYTFQGNFTCDGTETCGWLQTCAGWPECGGNPSGTERTTWGQLKMEFSE